MARSEARIFTDIWDDEDFLSAPPLAQRLYMFLISQRDLTHSGVIPLRMTRWARRGAGISATQIEQDLTELDARRFLIVDWDTGEVLVRSLIRRDKVYRQPNVMKAAIDYVPQIESQTILRALAAELGRIRAADADLSKPMLEALEAMEKALAERVVPQKEQASSQANHNPTEKGHGNPSGNATAKSPRGKGSVTAVPTEFPDSPLIPPPAATPSRAPSAEEQARQTVQALVGHWLERCTERPPQRVIGQMSSEIKRLVLERINPDHIRSAIEDFLTKDVSPSVLPSLVNAAMNRRQPASRASPPPVIANSPGHQLFRPEDHD